MVATVISALPRTGKSLYTMEILEKAVIDNPDRLIYTNIIGCKLPGVLPAVSRPDNPFPRPGRRAAGAGRCRPRPGLPAHRRSAHSLRWKFPHRRTHR